MIIINCIISVGALFFSCSLHAQYACNGYQELCSRRYNEVAYIHAHNASSNKKSPVQNQDRSITQQLEDGIRSMKVPVQNNYGDLLGYYYQALLNYKKILQKILDRFNKEEKIAQQKAEQKIQAATTSMQSQESSVDKEIEEEKKKYYSLPKFSLTEKSQTSESLSFAAKMAELEAKKGGLKVGQGASQVGKDIIKGVAPVTTFVQNPESALVAVELAAVNVALAFIEKTAHKKEDLELEAFACHGLIKSMLYRDYIQQAIDSAPKELKPILQSMQNPLTKLQGNIREQFFGKEKEIGGIFPYPACLLDTGRTSLTHVLTEIRQFLDTHPHEVVTLVLEVHDVDYTAIVHSIKKSGIEKYLQSQDPQKPWPTLGEMITSGKRMVIFTTGDVHKQYPFLNYYNTFSGWNTGWGFTKVEDFTKPFDPSKEITNLGFYDTQYPQNKFLSYTSSITPGLAGDLKSAQQVNERSVARARALGYMNAAQHIANFVSVDFYKYPSHDGKPDIFDVLDEINGVGKYAGKPLWQPKK